jgi:hypothetical protein
MDFEGEDRVYIDALPEDSEIILVLAVHDKCEFC